MNKEIKTRLYEKKEYSKLKKEYSKFKGHLVFKFLGKGEETLIIFKMIEENR